MSASAPERFAPADRVLKSALGRVQLLAHLTPVNFEQELARLCHASASAAAGPEFEYRRPAVDLSDVRRTLERAAPEWEELGEIGALYAERAREIALEAAICEARGTAALAGLAKERFDPGLALLGEADALADDWLACAAPHDGHTAELVRTDDEGDARSLIRRLRSAVGERRLGIRVVAAHALASLAAVGDGVVQVATERLVSQADVERTVMHELEGHVMPMVRAARAKLGLFAIGSARGSDHQEGWALLLERRAGFLGDKRRAELALRHKAARAAHLGEPFPEIVARLARAHAGRDAVVRAACRAFRGGGLGRELSYLPALLTVERGLGQEPELEHTLTSGRLSLEAARVLTRYPEYL